MDKLMKRKAMTLLELLVVVIIVGVLATLGLVNYAGVREHSMGKEAVANLKLIAAAERIYRMEIGYFFPHSSAPGPSVATINTNLRLSLPQGERWNYAIPAAATTTFTATATRNRTGSACVYTITQAPGEPTAANCP